MNNKLLIFIVVMLLSMSFVVATITVNSPANNTFTTQNTYNITINQSGITQINWTRNGTAFVNDYVGYWGANNYSALGDSAIKIIDNSIYGNNITLTTYTYNTGYVGKGILGNNAGSMQVNPTGSTNPLNMQTTSQLSFTWLVLFKPNEQAPTQCADDQGGGYTGQSFIEHRDMMLTLGIDEGNKPYFTYRVSTGPYGSGSANNMYLRGQKGVPYNQWGVYGAVVNNNTRTIQLYYQGILQDSYTWDASRKIESLSTYNNSTYFGSAFSATCWQFSRIRQPLGIMDEWRTFNRALTADEMAQQSGFMLEKINNNQTNLYVTEQYNILNNTVYQYNIAVTNGTITDTVSMNNSFNLNITKSILNNITLNTTTYTVITPSVCSQAYNDTLLVYISNSNFSTSVAQYFANQRGICNLLGIYVDNTQPYYPMRFSATNDTFYTPIKNKLNTIGNSNINYIVLSTEFPTYTTEETYNKPQVGFRYYAHSLDSDIADINFNDSLLWYDSTNRINNPYYAKILTTSEHFNATKYNFHIVTRIGGLNYTQSVHQIDDSANFTKASRMNINSTAVIVNVAGTMTTDMRAANITLMQMGVNITVYNETSGSGALPCSQNYSNVLFTMYYRPQISMSNGCWPNWTFAKGSFAYNGYSFAAQVPYTNNFALNGTGETQFANLLTSGATMVYGSSREPFTSGTLMVRTSMNSFNISGAYYGDIAWNSLPYLAWTQVVSADPKASDPIIYYPPTQTLLGRVNSTFYFTIQHPPSYNLTRFTTNYTVYKNGINTGINGSLTNLDILHTYNFTIRNGTFVEYDNLMISINLYMDGVFAGQFNQSYVGSDILSNVSTKIYTPSVWVTSTYIPSYTNINYGIGTAYDNWYNDTSSYNTTTTIRLDNLTTWSNYNYYITRYNTTESQSCTDKYNCSGSIGQCWSGYVYGNCNINIEWYCWDEDNCMQQGDTPEHCAAMQGCSWDNTNGACNRIINCEEQLTKSACDYYNCNGEPNINCADYGNCEAIGNNRPLCQATQGCYFDIVTCRRETTCSDFYNDPVGCEANHCDIFSDTYTCNYTGYCGGITPVSACAQHTYSCNYNSVINPDVSYTSGPYSFNTAANIYGSQFLCTNSNCTDRYFGFNINTTRNSNITTCSGTGVCT